MKKAFILAHSPSWKGEGLEDMVVGACVHSLWNCYQKVDKHEQWCFANFPVFYLVKNYSAWNGATYI